MASGVNKAILVGHLGQDPEIRYSKNNTAVVNVSIATTEVWKNKEGLKEEKTEWHKVVFFGKLGEVVGEYLLKGSLIYVEGKIETQKWQDKEGNDKYTTQIIARDMKMLGGKNGESAQKQNSGFESYDYGDTPF